jgi:primary-amine oxidase
LQVDGVQPMVTIEDCMEAEEIVKADAGMQALLKQRYGITDMAMVAADPWYYGDRFGASPLHVSHEAYQAPRILQ